MTELIDRRYFQELQKADPASICRRGRCSYDAATGKYTLGIWHSDFIVDPAHCRITENTSADIKLHEFFQLFAVYYLLQSADVKAVDEWISEKDLPGGPTFFRGPHLIPTDVIASSFGDDLEAFATACTSLGGEALPMADSAYRFTMTADIPIALLYWQGDADFGAEAKILYDRSIGQVLTLDIVFALAFGICQRFSRPKTASAPGI